MGEAAIKREATETAMHTLSRPAPEQPFLAADVGGTHARIGLVVGRADGRRPVSMLHYHRYGCADWNGLDAMLQDFLDQLAATPYAAVRARVRHCSVASAGCVLDGRIVNQNLPWPVSIADVNASLGLDRLVVINDFEALAYAAQFVTAEEIRPVVETAAAPVPGPVLVMGPGTGLGSAVLLPERERAPRRGLRHPSLGEEAARGVFQRAVLLAHPGGGKVRDRHGALLRRPWRGACAHRAGCGRSG